MMICDKEQMRKKVQNQAINVIPIKDELKWHLGQRGLTREGTGIQQDYEGHLEYEGEEQTKQMEQSERS